jgi:acetyl-CoA carboxylase biotin carboxyl carrier protein
MDMQELKDIIRLLKDEGLAEITVSDGDQRVTVKRLLQGGSFQQVQHPLAVETPAQPISPELPEREFSLTAPLVGTFFRRPSPDDEPFVAIGDRVQVGDTVCIIEAMKVMNEIKAEAPGIVRQSLLDDGAGVEFGQPLFIFEKP